MWPKPLWPRESIPSQRSPASNWWAADKKQKWSIKSLATKPETWRYGWSQWVNLTRFFLSLGSSSTSSPCRSWNSSVSWRLLACPWAKITYVQHPSSPSSPSHRSAIGAGSIWWLIFTNSVLPSWPERRDSLTISVNFSHDLYLVVPCVKINLEINQKSLVEMENKMAIINYRKYQNPHME